MAKKTAEKAEEIVYKNDAAAMTAMLEDMIANPNAHRPATLKDFLEPLWPLIQQAIAKGVPAGSIAAKLRDEKQLNVSDAAFRKFVNEKEGKTSEKATADAAAKAAKAAADAAAKASTSAKPKA